MTRQDGGNGAAGARRRARAGRARCVRRAGLELSCKGWQQEAALRMLMNNLDPEVAEKPDELIVYGGAARRRATGSASTPSCAACASWKTTRRCWCSRASRWASSRTHPDAPRVLIANANLVPAWATQEKFDELDRLGLTMYGQMTAGSWIYIGTQGILQGTYETLASPREQHFDGSLKGKLVLSAGLGGMGGAQPLAVTMNEGVALIVEVDERRIQRRLETRYLDEWTPDLDEALRMAEEPRRRARRSRSACWATPPRCSRSWCGAASFPTS